MKYYILNRDEVKHNIWANPMLVKTKCLAKINKIKSLQKQLARLQKEVEADLYNNNAAMCEERVNLLYAGENVTEITKQDYNALLVMCLLDTQEQRIKTCNKTEILKGKLYGNEIR